MWLLKTDTTKAQRYAKAFWTLTKCNFFKNNHLKKRFPKAFRGTRAYNYLTEYIFKDYLTASANQLIILHDDLFTHILNVPGKKFSQNEWYEYKKDHTIHPEYSAITDDEIAAIKSIFNYDNYISGNPELSYYIAELLDTNTCTYCNRQYTLTVVAKNGDRLIRPEFDHWFAQSLYPDLALSYFNLIPSCALCNSILKNNKETELDTHIHPYIDNNLGRDNEQGFKFSYRHLHLGGYSVFCNVNARNNVDVQRVKNTLELFKIEEVYNAHADLELKDLIDLASENSGDYIQDLVTHVLNNTTLSEEDVFRILFGVEWKSSKYLNRPMSKFKHDIMLKIHDYIIKKGTP